jgi:hypothetical protein
LEPDPADPANWIRRIRADIETAGPDPGARGPRALENAQNSLKLPPKRPKMLENPPDPASGSNCRIGSGRHSIPNPSPGSDCHRVTSIFSLRKSVGRARPNTPELPVARPERCPTQRAKITVHSKTFAARSSLRAIHTARRRERHCGPDHTQGPRGGQSVAGRGWRVVWRSLRAEPSCVPGTGGLVEQWGGIVVAISWEVWPDPALTDYAFPLTGQPPKLA